MRANAWGALAILCTVLVGMNAWGEADHYPLFHKWFNGEGEAVARLVYILCTLGASFFGYLAGAADSASKRG